MKILVALLFVIVSVNVSAQTHQGGTFTVESLRYDSGGLKVRFDPALTACQGGENYRMHAQVPYTQANSKYLSSALLAAYTANKTLKYVWTSGEGSACSSSHVLNLDMIEFTNN